MVVLATPLHHDLFNISISNSTTVTVHPSLPATNHIAAHLSVTSPTHLSTSTTPPHQPHQTILTNTTTSTLLITLCRSSSASSACPSACLACALRLYVSL